MPAVGVSLSEVSVTPASVSHELPAVNVCFGMAPRVYVPTWLGREEGVPLLPSPPLLSISSPSSFSSLLSSHFPSPALLSPRGPREISLSCQSGNLLRNTHVISCISFANSLPHSFYGASWNVLQDGLPAPKSLSSSLLPGEPMLRPADRHVEACICPPFSQTFLFLLTKRHIVCLRSVRFVFLSHVPSRRAHTSTSAFSGRVL